MPRSNAAEAEETRRALREAAARGFRTRGYGALGIDAVAKEAGVTSGAFYSHFASKAVAFREILRDGLDDLINGIATWRGRQSDWLRPFAQWYLNPKRRADIATSCALPVLSMEAARSDDETRELYTEKLKELIAAIDSDPSAEAQERAIVILALLSGGMMMAHAVGKSRIGTQIARAVAKAIGDLE